MLGRPQIALAAIFVTIALLAILSTQGSAATTIRGDADCNQTVNASDALQILRGAASLSGAYCVSSANVDCQNGTNVVDALLILRYAAGLPATIDPAACSPIGADIPTPNASADPTPGSPTPSASGTLTPTQSLTLTPTPTHTPTQTPTPTPSPMPPPFCGYPTLSNVSDSLGNVNPNSWGKGTGGDWPGGAKPTIHPDVSITFTATAQSPCGHPLQYRFEIQPTGGSFITLQDWSSSNGFTWMVTNADIGESTMIIVEMRDNDSYSRFGSIGDDYTYMTYNVSP